MKKQRQILALDVGEKRVGVAYSIENSGLATPLETWPKPQGRAEKLLLSYCRDNDVIMIVVGNPVSAAGEKTVQAEKVARFVERLQKRVQVPIEMVDEHLSSVEAKERLGITGAPTKEQRESGVIDAMAAVIILETYLQGVRSK